MAISSATSTAGLDVNGIVTQLMALERRPLNKLDTQEASYQAKLTAYGTIKGAIASFQSAVQGLNNSNIYQSLKATTSDATVLSASATSTAVAGTYSLEVSALAQAQKLISAGQASSTAAIGTGAATTITFDFGSISGGALTPFDPVTNTGGTYAGSTFTGNGNPSKSITIDGTNNTLQGIRDAINSAQLGVTATILNDGSDTPYRLSLSTSSAGANNSLRMTVAGGGDATVTSLLEHDPAGTQSLSQTAAAQNASFTVNGLSISKSSNTVTDVIDGVTLNLSKVTTAPVSVTVARDTGTITNAVSAFVKAYNDLSGTLKNSSAYDPATKQGAILQGDSTVRQLQTQLRNMLSTPVVGTSGGLTTLSDVGISFQRDGTIALDQTKLNTAVTNFPGDIANLFASTGKSSDNLISFSSAATGAKPGKYAVNITQVATQGTAIGSALTLPTSIVSGVNDTLDLVVNGISASVTLSAGDYTTAQALAAELQAKINASSNLSSASVAVAVSASITGSLTITSLNYGSTSSVSITSGSAQASLGLSAPTQTTGVDVAGSIGGTVAVGEGQKLISQGGAALGLSITVNGGALGDRGFLYYSQGYASSLDSWSTMTLSSKGTLSSRTDGINQSITDIGKRRDTMNVRLAQIEKIYRAQYSRLDAMLGSMNQTSLYLTQQLSQLSQL